MNRKKTLKLTILVLVLFGMVISALPFIFSLSPNASSKQDVNIEIFIKDLDEGIVYRYELGRKLILVLKPTKIQLESVRNLDDHVWDKSYSDFNGVFVLIGHSTSTKGGCGLSHYPKDVSRLSNTKDAEWNGGYWDVACEVSYDYAGRAIKTYEKTYNGYIAQVKNLGVPIVSVLHNKKIVITVHG